MSAHKKKPEPIKLTRVGKTRPADYREWALWRMRKRVSRKKEIVGCSSRALHRPPRYLVLAASYGDEAEFYDWVGNANVAAEHLKQMRDEGLITCTDGWWWRRQPHKLRAVK